MSFDTITSCVAHLEETIRGWLTDKVDLTLEEMSQRLAGLGIMIKGSALWTRLDQ